MKTGRPKENRVRVVCYVTLDTYSAMLARNIESPFGHIVDQWRKDSSVYHASKALLSEMRK